MEKALSVPFESQKIVGDVLGDNPCLIILHGAGVYNRARYTNLRQFLFSNGISSCAFDFIGHGETGGELSSSSLELRTKVAQEVLKHLDLPKPISVLGSSMGAYTAIRLS